MYNCASKRPFKIGYCYLLPVLVHEVRAFCSFSSVCHLQAVLLGTNLVLRLGTVNSIVSYCNIANQTKEYPDCLRPYRPTTRTQLGFAEKPENSHHRYTPLFSTGQPGLGTHDRPVEILTTWDTIREKQTQMERKRGKRFCTIKIGVSCYPRGFQRFTQSPYFSGRAMGEYRPPFLF